MEPKYDASQVSGIKAYHVPANFNPLTATDQELAQYGFPPRPTDSAGLSEWIDVMSHAKNFINSSFRFKHGQAPQLTTHVPNLTWSGYVYQSGGVTNVQGEWNVSPIKLGPSGKLGSRTTWVGIGGYGTSSVTQCGTIAHMEQGAFSDYATYQSVFQINNGTVVDTGSWSNLTISPGDEVYADVWYDSSNVPHFFVEDLTTGTVPNPISGPTGYEDTSEGEWIIERPSGDFGPSYLAEYDTGINVKDMYLTVNGVGQVPSLTSSYWIPLTMTDTGTLSGTVMANVSGLSLDSNSRDQFTDYWHSDT